MGYRSSTCCATGNTIAWRCFNAFDLIELDGDDLRLWPIEYRKRALGALLSPKRDGIALNTHYQCDGAVIYTHACKLGCEGIVSMSATSTR
jgi:bifunctional non-homologous end joining protein LigD